jgi:predicted RNA polymerase sigma factor
VIRGATQRTVEAVWRIESARLIGGLARMVRDVNVAEDLAQDALVAALEKWPQSGVPDNPGAWLMATAKHRAIDLMRRRRRLETKQQELAWELGVLEVVYLIFNEGYAATAGDDWMRPALCEDALRLGRILATLAPEQSEVHGLVALMEIQASRTPARTNARGEPVLLLDQDRSRWDRLLIVRGLQALARAEALGLGPYGLQAAIAACHARARTAEETDWVRIAALYETLARVSPSPVVELNRAVAIGMAFGPDAALRHVERLLDEPALREYHLLPSVRADLLSKLGRDAEARAEWRRAAELTANARERELLLARADAV